MFKSTKKLVHQFRDHCQIFLRTQKNSQIPFCKPKLNRRVPSRARSAREGTRAFSPVRCRRKCRGFAEAKTYSQTSGSSSTNSVFSPKSANSTEFLLLFTETKVPPTPFYPLNKIRHYSTKQPLFCQKFSYQIHLKTPTNAAVMPNSRNCKKIPEISKNILKLFPKYGKI